MTTPTNTTSVPAPQYTTPPVADLSQPAVSVARDLDRLPPGTYNVTIQKPDIKAVGWRVEIVREEIIKRNYQPE